MTVGRIRRMNRSSLGVTTCRRRIPAECFSWNLIRGQRKPIDHFCVVVLGLLAVRVHSAGFLVRGYRVCRDRR